MQQANQRRERTKALEKARKLAEKAEAANKALVSARADGLAKSKITKAKKAAEKAHAAYDTALEVAEAMGASAGSLAALPVVDELPATPEASDDDDDDEVGARPASASRRWANHGTAKAKATLGATEHTDFDSTRAGASKDLRKNKRKWVEDTQAALDAYKEASGATLADSWVNKRAKKMNEASILQSLAGFIDTERKVLEAEREEARKLRELLYEQMFANKVSRWNQGASGEADERFTRWLVDRGIAPSARSTVEAAAAAAAEEAEANNDNGGGSDGEDMLGGAPPGSDDDEEEPVE